MSQSSLAVPSRPGIVTRRKLKTEQIQSHLLREIDSGNLRPGDVLPAEHDLAAIMGVSRSTIRKTLEEMEKKGRIRRERGRGTLVAEQVVSATLLKSPSYALIVPDVASAYYASLLGSFEQAAHESGRSAVVCSSNNQVDKQASQILRLMDEGVAGVVLNPSSYAPTPVCQVRMLQRSGIPVVLLHRPVEGVSAPLVKLSSEEIDLRASRLLGEAGHRHVAFMTSGSRESVAQREEAFRRGLADLGIGLPSSHVACGGMAHFGEEEYAERERFVESAFWRFMGLPQRPTAVFVSFDSVAEVAYLVVQKMGMRIPEDLSLVTFGSARREGAIMQRLTTITVDEGAAIRRAVEFIDDIRQGKRSLTDNAHAEMSLGISSGETLARLSSSSR